MTENDTATASHCLAQPAQKLPSWQQAVEAWLAAADLKTLTTLGIAAPDSEYLSAHINRVTWVLGAAIVASMALLGHHDWGWQTVLAVGAVFASNGYNRFHFGLKSGGLAIGAAAVLGLAGLAGALGAPIPGAFSALILLLHWLWYAV